MTDRTDRTPTGDLPRCADCTCPNPGACPEQPAPLRDQLAEALYQWTLSAAAPGGTRPPYLDPRTEERLRENSSARADAVLPVVEAALTEQRERAKRAEASAAAAVHLLEHWADEHVILRAVDGTEVHADWCYRCRIEAADEQRQRAEKAERERDEARAERDDYATRLRLTDAAYGELLGENDEQRRRAVDALAAVQRVRDLHNGGSSENTVLCVACCNILPCPTIAALDQPEETLDA